MYYEFEVLGYYFGFVQFLGNKLWHIFHNTTDRFNFY